VGAIEGPFEMYYSVTLDIIEPNMNNGTGVDVQSTLRYGMQTVHKTQIVSVFCKSLTPAPALHLSFGTGTFRYIKVGRYP